MPTKRNATKRWENNGFFHLLKVSINVSYKCGARTKEREGKERLRFNFPPFDFQLNILPVLFFRLIFDFFYYLSEPFLFLFFFIHSFVHFCSNAITCSGIWIIHCDSTLRRSSLSPCIQFREFFFLSLSRLLSPILHILGLLKVFQYFSNWKFQFTHFASGNRAHKPYSTE